MEGTGERDYNQWTQPLFRAWSQGSSVWCGKELESWFPGGIYTGPNQQEMLYLKIKVLRLTLELCVGPDHFTVWFTFNSIVYGKAWWKTKSSSIGLTQLLVFIAALFSLWRFHHIFWNMQFCAQCAGAKRGLHINLQVTEWGRLWDQLYISILFLFSVLIFFISF